MKFTQGQVIGCIIGGAAWAVLYGGAWKVWTDPIGDLIGGILAAFLLVSIVKLIGRGWKALFRKDGRRDGKEAG